MVNKAVMVITCRLSRDLKCAISGGRHDRRFFSKFSSSIPLFGGLLAG